MSRTPLDYPEMPAAEHVAEAHMAASARPESAQCKETCSAPSGDHSTTERWRCRNRTRHPSGRCVSHRPRMARALAVARRLSAIPCKEDR